MPRKWHDRYKGSRVTEPRDNCVYVWVTGKTADFLLHASHEGNKSVSAYVNDLIQEGIRQYEVKHPDPAPPDHVRLDREGDTAWARKLNYLQRKVNEQQYDCVIVDTGSTEPANAGEGE